MTFGDELIALLAQELGVIAGSTLFLGSKAVIPPTGSVLSIAETGGAGPLFEHNSNVPTQQRPTAQLVARAQNYEDAEALARRAYNATIKFNTTLSGTSYQRLVPVQEPFELGADDTGRVRFAFNVSAVKSPS